MKIEFDDDLVTVFICMVAVVLLSIVAFHGCSEAYRHTEKQAEMEHKK